MSKIFLSNIFLLFFFSALLNTGLLYGQGEFVIETETDSTQRVLNIIEADLPMGNIKISQDKRLDLLLRKHISYNDSVGIQGWKILIYRGRELKKAQDAGALFNSVFPDLEMIAFVDYQAPDFKTLVGAFRTREEAYRFHNQIKSYFEFSYLVQTAIKASEMK